jgi:hypothetical protein
LTTVAHKVEARAGSYQAQLVGCEDELKRDRGLFDWL